MKDPELLSISEAIEKNLLVDVTKEACLSRFPIPIYLSVNLYEKVDKKVLIFGQTREAKIRQICENLQQVSKENPEKKLQNFSVTFLYSDQSAEILDLTAGLYAIDNGIPW